MRPHPPADGIAPSRPRQVRSSRRGSVLIVVVGMLGLLLLLGFTFLTFSSQENQSSEVFSEAAKYPRQADPDALFDFAMNQVILGAPNTSPRSALFSGGPIGRHSLLAGILGADSAPFTGEGVNVSFNDVTEPDGSGLSDGLPDGPTQYSDAADRRVVTGTNRGAFGIDRDRNGLLDRADMDSSGNAVSVSNADELLDFNFSSMANRTGNAATEGTIPSIPLNPAPDVDYTYPDINNLFLAYIGKTIHPQTGADIDVIIPSFHRPQYLRNVTNGSPYLDWYSNNSTIRRSLRPHYQHILRNPSTGTTAFRYIRPGDAPVYNSLGLQVGSFPFIVNRDGDATTNEQGVFSGSDFSSAIARKDADQNEYDVDNDQDGTYEGVWLDVDGPVFQLPDNRFYLPLVSFTILDGDGLLNLNEVGNMAGAGSNASSIDKSIVMGTQSISRSNMGLSRSEINPTYAFSLDPSSDPIPAAEGAQYRAQYNLPTSGGSSWPSVTRIQLANLELANILLGRLKFDSSGGSYSVSGVGNFTPGTINDVTAGRWGEPYNFLDAIVNSTDGIITTPNTFAHGGARFPRPGLLGQDDNGNILAGYNFNDSYVTSLSAAQGNVQLIYPGAQHPLDYRGNGGRLSYSTATGKDYVARTVLQGGTGPAIFRQYDAFQGSTGYSTGTYGGAVILNGRTDQTLDEPAETLTEPAYTSPNDQIFGVDEMLGLQLSLTDRNAVSGSRLRTLASINFDQGGTEAQRLAIRRRFTTTSWDRRQFGFGSRQFATNYSTTGSPVSDLNKYPASMRDLYWDNIKAWESRSYGKFNLSTPANNVRSFPPWFETASNIDSNSSTDVYSYLQPVRSALFELLRVRPEKIVNQSYQNRLNINRLLWYPHTPTLSNNPTFTGYRPLTPHPYDPGAAAIPAASSMFGTDGAPGQAGVDDDGNGITDYDSGDSTKPDLNEFGFRGSDDLAPGQVDFDPSTSGNQAMSAAQQEFWARRDRQLMARDIYVLLYLLGGGMTNVNYATTSNAASGTPPVRPLYSNEQLREMAQFAVNMVDALDPDSVISAFEYDMDLQNGWNVNDNPFDSTTTTDPAVSTNDRGVVYGIEKQELAFNEVFAISMEKTTASTGGNLASTTYDDQMDAAGNPSGTDKRKYLFVELVNPTTNGVNLAGDVWRLEIGLSTQSVPTAITDATSVQRRIKIRDGSLTPGDTALGTYVNPGQAYTIGTRSGSDIDTAGTGGERPSNLRINYNRITDPTKYYSIAPASASGTILDTSTADPGPGCNLDLRWAAHSSKFQLTDGSGGTGGGITNLVDQINDTDSVRLYLSRRLHPTRAAGASEADNPWVIVDRFTGEPFMLATLTSSGIEKTDSEIQTTINSVGSAFYSAERRQPLQRVLANGSAGEVQYSNTTNTLYPNTLGNAKNKATSDQLGGNFTLTQAHFDRDYSSVFELLALPLVGPDQLTEALPRMQDITAIRDSARGLEWSVAKKVLRPDFSGATNLALQNRWYRLFELLEVPDSQNAFAGLLAVTGVPRTPGKINLNTIRDPAVLSGLVDDYLVNHYSSRLSGNNDTNRDWWCQFIKARDQQDPVTGLYLPGMPVSRPFRSLSFAGTNVSRYEYNKNTSVWEKTVGRAESGLERTILRSVAGDYDSFMNAPAGANPHGFSSTLFADLDSGAIFAQRRQLFEARTNNDLGNNEVDLSTRYRLLSKIHNNSTTRSNVFYCWATIGFFEGVYDNNARGFRIGAELSGPGGPLERKRAFFVLDRSDLEKAYNPISQTFEFRKFIKLRRYLK